MLPAGMLLLSTIILIGFGCQGKIGDTNRILKQIEVSRGICVILGDVNCELTISLAQETDLLIYVQLSDSDDVEAARQLIDSLGFFGTRVFVEKGTPDRVHLADNLADALIAVGEETKISESEVLRVLRPHGKALIGGKEIVKPFPVGVDEWSHPYHGPDNNPQSEDRIARAPYLTQFLAEPYYAPLTQVSVASNGRVFKAFGNIAFHVREEALLNTLAAFNGYNGTMLWKRELTPGVMIHRNTMIATPDILYVGDDKSCKVIDAATGELTDEIVPATDIAGGTFWKWMALENGILYALIGDQEQKDPVVRQRRKAHGWPWNPLSKGFNQPDNPWGFGHNLLAVNPKTKKVLWNFQSEESIDSRALCMKNGRIYIYKHDTFLACLDAKTGKEIWRKTPENAPELYIALGDYLHRQDWRTNWRTTAYLKCSDEALYFAGPTVGKLLAVSAEDGTILWEDPYDNYQLVIRDDGLYGISGQIDEHVSKRFDPLTGEVLAEFDTYRRACARPNGAIDAVFYRAEGGSGRLDIESQSPHWISPMRAQCHDGVTIANGLLYWWPSVCDCQNTLYGITSLGPAGDFDFSQKATEKERLEQGDFSNVASLEESPADWPAFRANNHCDVTTEAVIPQDIKQLWWFTPNTGFIPTAPVTVGDLLFFSGSNGVVWALDATTGDVQWKAYTGGSVRYPPTIWEGRVLVGSGDGWVYAFEAVTGRLLWRFNAAPEQRKMPVYGALMSTWPVASGVIIEDGIAYFAAGIVNYDGIHVYALDAATGEIKWQNNTSGHLNAEARTGASVQGHMLINDGKLYMAGGTSVSPVVYDLADGKCLNDPALLELIGSTSPRGRELYKIGDKVVACGMPFYGHPEYPVYDPTVFNKMLHTSADGLDVVCMNNRKIMCFDKIDNQLLNNSVYDPAEEPFYMSPGWGKLNIEDKPLWEFEGGEIAAIARGKNAIVFSRSSTEQTGRGTASSIAALDINNGKSFWQWEPSLPSAPVPWGLAADHKGRIIVTLVDGQVVCFGQAD